MTSYRQIEANRRNALKSTGPRTETGKQVSRCNAVRHGLTAETVLSALEDAEDYKAFEAAITADYDAQSAVERELVLRLASILWRLRRATTMETGRKADATAVEFARCFLRLANLLNFALDRLSRYESDSLAPGRPNPSRAILCRWVRRGITISHFVEWHATVGTYSNTWDTGCSGLSNCPWFVCLRSTARGGGVAPMRRLQTALSP
jgi:hypothetical protein